MRTIEKGADPKCLHAARAGAAGSGYVWPPPEEGCSDAIREALVEEQGALCAYCMQRIKPHGYRDGRPGDGGMKIEHWLDRRDHEERMYDWTNLLGVCGGEYEDANGRVEHCDKAKGNADLALHPATGTAPRPEDVLEFKRRPPDGEDPPFQGVWVHGTTDGAKQDIATLNLNADHLVRNRRAAVDAVDKQLRRTNNPARNRRVLRKILAEVTADAGELPVFSRMVAEHVRRKLRRYEGSP